jgi:endonuclease YncB( thermonuclease family)
MDSVKDLFRAYSYDTPEFGLTGKKCWARVVSVYDGDTCTLIIPFQAKMYKFSARLYGIDTSEMKSKDNVNKERAIRSRNRLIELITRKALPSPIMSKKDVINMLANDVHLVWIECMELDKYGRVLVKLHDSEEAEVQGLPHFAEVLVSENLAYQYFGQTKLTEKEQAVL